MNRQTHSTFHLSLSLSLSLGLALALTFAAAAHAAPAPVTCTSISAWPGNAFTTNSVFEPRDGASAVFFNFMPGSVFTFSHPTDGRSWLAFVGVNPGTTTEYADAGNANSNVFLVDGNDKTMVSSVLAAYAAKQTFRLQYTRDASFMNRPIMLVKAIFFK